MDSPRNASLTVDARHLACPMPLLKAKQGLNKIEVGQRVEVLVSDPASERDFHAFARLSSHEIVEFKNTGSVLVYVLQKGQ